MNTTVQNLHAAAQYLRTFGWKRYDMGVDNGPRCIMGAIESATYCIHVTATPEYDALLNALEDTPYGVSGYNDIVCQNVDDACAFIERVAAELES